MLEHSCRHDGKMVKYRNEYINQELSYQNEIIVQHIGRRFDDLSGRKEVERLKKRIEEIDKMYPPKRVRKDRVTSISFCVTAPEGLTLEEEKWFFEMSYRKIEEMCGGPLNVSVGYVHRDEIHEYIDAVTGEKRMSRAHMHVVGLPFVTDVGINGKKFMTKERMSSLNRTIDRECRDTIQKQFMTRNKGLCGRSVEDLQAESVAIAKKQAIEQAEKQHQEVLDNLKKVSAETKSMEEDLQELTEKKEVTVRELDSLKRKFSNVAEKYNSLVIAYNQLMEVVKQLTILVNEHLINHQRQIQR